MKLYAFQGYRYNQAAVDAAAQAAPPFDQIDETLRARLHAQSPHQFARVTKPVGDGALTPHERSAALHREWIEQGVVKRDRTPSVYPYAITEPDGASRLGLCALVGVEPGREGDLWPHEQTVAKSRAERLDLLRLSRIDIEPVFYLAEDDGTLERLLAEDCGGGAGDALVRHTDPWTGDVHALYRITDRERIGAYAAALAERPRRHRRRPSPHPGGADLRRRRGRRQRHGRRVQDGRANQPGLREPADRPGPPRNSRARRPRGDGRPAGRKRAAGSGHGRRDRRPRRRSSPAVTRRLVPGRREAPELWTLDPDAAPADTPGRKASLPAVLLHYHLFATSGVPIESATDGSIAYEADPADIVALLQRKEVTAGVFLPPMTPRQFALATEDGDLLPAQVDPLPAEARLRPGLVRPRRGDRARLSPAAGSSEAGARAGVRSPTSGGDWPLEPRRVPTDARSMGYPQTARLTARGPRQRSAGRPSMSNWIAPQYSKRRVDRAGQVLAEAPVERLPEDDLRVFANWRSSHAFPLNTFQVYLRGRARAVSSDPVVSQRLKRTPSTIEKLRRFPRMKLSQMQDIGGCRAVVDTVDEVRLLREAYRSSRIRHCPVNGKDYITAPKDSGYRGVHLVYRYRSPRNETYNGLLIEIQLRTRLQHAWATAVETAGAFLGQALKSSEGEEEWLRFFALASSAFALVEGCAPVPSTPTDIEQLRAEIRSLSDRLDLINRFRDYRALIGRIPIVRSVEHVHFFLLERRPDLKSLYVTTYGTTEHERILEDYFIAEQKVRGIDGAEVVLVSADSIQAVQRAYPNYQLDTGFFLQRLRQVLG